MVTNYETFPLWNSYKKSFFKKANKKKTTLERKKIYIYDFLTRQSTKSHCLAWKFYKKYCFKFEKLIVYVMIGEKNEFKNRHKKTFQQVIKKI